LTNKNPAVVPRIISNCKRLLSDARLLLENGSPGSALALAVLAFEEGGKGHYHELSFEKTKRTPSWHHFRQVVAAFVLYASVCQKYSIEAPEFTDRMRELMEERWEGAKTLSEVAAKPIPEEYRRIVREAASPTISNLSSDQMVVAQAEFRWVGKIVKAASQGVVEIERQRGMYVDVIGGELTSHPEDVSSHTAFYWIRAAERLLLLLEFGDYVSPYGELASTLEGLPKPLPTGQDLVDLLLRFQSDGLAMLEAASKQAATTE
jgi:hypothetical protein